MKYRPLCLLCAIWLLLVCFFGKGGPPLSGDGRLDAWLKRQDRVLVEGLLVGWQRNSEREEFILDNSVILIRDQTIPIPRCIIRQKTDRHCPFNRGCRGLYALGDRLKVRGRLSRISGPKREGDFDARSFYAARRIYYELEAQTMGPGSKQEKIGENRDVSLPARLRAAWWKGEEYLIRQKEKITRFLADRMGERESGTLIALLVGDRSRMEDDIREDYRRAGLSHILSISGMHIMLIGMMVFRLILAGPFSQGMAGLVSLLSMTVYCALIGWPISALRALVMFAVFMAARTAKRSYDLKNSLALSCLIITSVSPARIFTSSFQLSFLAVLGMALVYPALVRLLPPDLYHRGNVGKKALQGMLRFCLAWLSVTLVTAPALAWHFGELPLLGLVTNALILPLLGALLAGGILGTGLMACRPLAGLLLGFSGLCIRWMELVAGAAGRLPFAVWSCGRPSGLFLGLYYGSLCLAVLVLGRLGDRVFLQIEKG